VRKTKEFVDSLHAEGKGVMSRLFWVSADFKGLGAALARKGGI